MVRDQRERVKRSRVCPCGQHLAIEIKPLYHFLQMVRFAKIAKIIVALLCIACVLALCIAPYVDIPFTVLKSLQVVLLLMVSFLAGALLLANLFRQVLIRYALVRSDLRTPARCPVLPLETNCVQQC